MSIFEQNKIKTYNDLKGRTWNQSGIPKWIFRFGNESVENLHPKIIELYRKQLEDNPEYELFYFDTNDKLLFIRDCDDHRIELTYNKLIPPAYKSDFLKFVLLYSYGGVYMDFSMKSLIPLKDIFNGYKRILAKDSPAPDGMCIGFITSEKGDELMRESMEKCIYNTTHNLYGVSALDITGPTMFARVYKKLNNVDVIPIGKVSDDLYFYNMGDSLNIYDGGSINDDAIIKLRIENHHKLLYNYEWYEDSSNNLHYGNLYHKGKVFSRKINTYQDLKEKVWQEDCIPKWIFKTGPFELDELPKVYEYIFIDILDKNPGYELFYFSDTDCENYIRDNYNEDYVIAYNTLIPKAYKADFWRYLILYKHGGCYGDFSQSMITTFDNLTENMNRVLVVDSPESPNSLYNAFMCVKPEDDVIKRTIDISKNNIDNKNYGVNPLDVTGPRVLGRAYCEVVYNDGNLPITIGKYGTTNMLENPNTNHSTFIINNHGGQVILKKLNNHTHTIYKNSAHYSNMWHMNEVFKTEMNMKFISFYTEDYAQYAKLLKKSLENFGIDSSNVEYREKIGSWEVNTQIKAEFILEKLRDNDSVVWTDADSYILHRPSFFEDITTDVALYFLPKKLSGDFILPKHSILKNVDKYLQSGTMYFKNNDRVINLLETWIEINKRDSKQWDQWTLQMALEKSDVTITQLPPEYISAGFIAEMYPNIVPVIKHTQASSRNKDIVR